MRKRFLTALVFACALVYVLAIGIIVLRFGYNPRHLSGLSYAIIAIGSAAILVSLLVYFIYSRRGLVFNLKEFTAVFVCIDFSDSQAQGRVRLFAYLHNTFDVGAARRSARRRGQNTACRCVADVSDGNPDGFARGIQRVHRYQTIELRA